MAPATYFSMMASAADALHVLKDVEIREDVEVLRLLQTHNYGNGLRAKTRDLIYRHGRNYRWMGGNLF